MKPLLCCSAFMHLCFGFQQQHTDPNNDADNLTPMLEVQTANTKGANTDSCAVYASI